MADPMSYLNFSGFFYVEGEGSLSKIDGSFGFHEDISDYTNDAVTVNYIDIINKFTKPLCLSRNEGTFSQKFIVENAAFIGTPEDRTTIDTADEIWKYVFNIANYVFNKGYEDPKGQEANLDKILSGEVLDPDINPTAFRGFVKNSLSLSVAGNMKLSKIQFNYYNSLVVGSSTRSFTLYVNAQSFVTEFKSDSPKIYVYYTEDLSITQEEQAAEFMKLFNNIGRDYMNNYSTLLVPLFSTAETAQKLTFHIFTKGYTIPVNPLEDVTILDVIQNTIKIQEPGLSAEERIQKYPTIFINESRAIWCFFNDNRTLGNLRITDPENPGTTIYYNANPISLTKIQNTIATQPILGGIDGDLGGYNTYEITTIGNGRWFPILIAGRNGALTDKVPKYLPALEEIENVSKEGQEARDFFGRLDRVINYIMGKTIITTNEMVSLGITDTENYVSFKMYGAIWKVYKRDFVTDGDL